MDVTGKSSDRGKFKVPSLRNVEKTGPYMHDGRFQTLEEVVDFYNNGINISNTISPIMVKIDVNGDSTGIANGLFLTNQEKSDLIAFLKALTDEEFLTNPIYADPN
jgi:cytochrome c peroxidase